MKETETVTSLLQLVSSLDKLLHPFCKHSPPSFFQQFRTNYNFLNNGHKFTQSTFCVNRLFWCQKVSVFIPFVKKDSRWWWTWWPQSAILISHFYSQSAQQFSMAGHYVRKCHGFIQLQIMYFCKDSLISNICLLPLPMLRIISKL